MGDQSSYRLSSPLTLSRSLSLQTQPHPRPPAPTPSFFVRCPPPSLRFSRDPPSYLSPFGSLRHCGSCPSLLNSPWGCPPGSRLQPGHVARGGSDEAQSSRELGSSCPLLLSVDATLLRFPRSPQPVEVVYQRRRSFESSRPEVARVSLSRVDSAFPRPRADLRLKQWRIIRKVIQYIIPRTPTRTRQPRRRSSSLRVTTIFTPPSRTNTNSKGYPATMPEMTRA